MSKDEIKTGIYRHYKGGEYRVLGCARHSETGEELVIYQGLDDERELWARPKNMFLESVDVNDKEIPRFKYLQHEDKIKAMEKHIAMCGLDCAKCDAFIATKNNDNKMRERVAIDWTERHIMKEYSRPALKAKDINCKGCLSDGPIYLYCGSCDIRKCGLKKGISSCEECSKYKCAILIEKHSHLR